MISEKQLKLLLRKLCHHYGIRYIPTIVLDKSDMLKDAVGKLINNSTIVIKDQNDDNATLLVFYHEFRHVWQWTRYPFLIIWYETHRNLYNHFYNSILIEIDANSFAQKCVASQGKFWRSDTLASRERNLDMVQSALLCNILYNAEDVVSL